MPDSIKTGPPVPVLAATPERMKWKAVASWTKSTGASLAAIIMALAQDKATVAPLIPVKYAWAGAVIFAIGQVLETIQIQKDVTRPKEPVNLSVPQTYPDDGNPTP